MLFATTRRDSSVALAIFSKVTVASASISFLILRWLSVNFSVQFSVQFCLKNTMLTQPF